MARVSQGASGMDSTTPPRIPPDMWEDLRRAADERGLDPRVLLRWLLAHALAALPRIERLDSLARSVVVVRGREGGEDGQQR